MVNRELALWMLKNNPNVRLESIAIALRTPSAALRDIYTMKIQPLPEDAKSNNALLVELFKKSPESQEVRKKYYELALKMNVKVIKAGRGKSEQLLIVRLPKGDVTRIVRELNFISGKKMRSYGRHSGDRTKEWHPVVHSIGYSRAPTTKRRH